MDPTAAPALRPRVRLRSLDAFRGATIALMILVNNAGDWSKTYAPLLHAQSTAINGAIEGVDLSGNPGSYDWTVPNNPTTQALVRVKAFDQAGNNGADVSDGFFSMGIWNTFGEQTIQFPDRNSAFANPCGGLAQLWNSMTKQGITLNRVNLNYRIGQWRRFSSVVSMRKGWPTACNTFRKATLYAGIRLGPNAPLAPPSGSSGLPNVAFIQVVPMVSASVFGCLREQFASLPPDVYTDLPLIVKARASGIERPSIPSPSICRASPTRVATMALSAAIASRRAIDIASHNDG